MNESENKWPKSGEDFYYIDLLWGIVCQAQAYVRRSPNRDDHVFDLEDIKVFKERGLIFKNFSDAEKVLKEIQETYIK